MCFFLLLSSIQFHESITDYLYILLLTGLFPGFGYDKVPINILIKGCDRHISYFLLYKSLGIKLLGPGGFNKQEYGISLYRY